MVELIPDPLDEIEYRAFYLLQNPDTPRVELEQELWAITEICGRARRDNAQFSERLAAVEGALGMWRAKLRLVSDDD